MKHKVVYNNCFGGFGLSEKAMKRYLKLKGIEYKCSKDQWGAHFEDNSGNPIEEDYIPRHDPILVAVVEELGKDASGSFAELQVQEIKSNKYRIEEYDGNETVIEPDDEWFITI